MKSADRTLIENKMKQYPELDEAIEIQFALDPITILIFLRNKYKELEDRRQHG